jgi:hypothetical protein
MALWIALSAVVLLVVAALVMQSITGKSYIQPMTDSELKEMPFCEGQYKSRNDSLNPASPFYTDTKW